MIKIKLEDYELKFLKDFVNKGQKNASEITRAHIQLLCFDSQINPLFVGKSVGLCDGF